MSCAREHTFVILPAKADSDERLGVYPVNADFTPAVEAAKFAAARSGELPLGASPERATIVPRTSRLDGPPFVMGFSVVLDLGHGRERVEHFSTAFFGAHVQLVSASLVRDGKLQAGEEFTYRIAARALEENRVDDAEPPPLHLVARPLSTAWSPPNASLAERIRDAAPVGDIFMEDAPLFVPSAVVQALGEHALAAQPNECGGVLLGHVYRDPVEREVFVEVTAYVPAPTQGTSTRFAFNSEAWAAVDAAIRIRGRAERMVAWFHAHPSDHWKEEGEPASTASLEFFSAHDVHLHRTVFPAAWATALLATVINGVPRMSAWGWRKARVVQRGFHLIDNVASAEAGAEGERHAS